MVWMRAARMPLSRHTAEAQPNAEDRWAEQGHGSRSSPAFRTRMDFAACCITQGLSLAPTRPRSCELSPGHALGPSARVAGVYPCPIAKDLRSSLRPRSGIVAATASRCRVSKTIATRPSPERDAIDDISPIAKIKNKKRTMHQLFFLKIRKSLSAEARHPHSSARSCCKDVDARHKAGHDDSFNGNDLEQSRCRITRPAGRRPSARAWLAPSRALPDPHGTRSGTAAPRPDS